MFEDVNKIIAHKKLLIKERLAAEQNNKYNLFVNPKTVSVKTIQEDDKKRDQARRIILKYKMDSMKKKLIETENKFSNQYADFSKGKKKKSLFIEGASVCTSEPEVLLKSTLFNKTKKEKDKFS